MRDVIKALLAFAVILGSFFLGRSLGDDELSVLKKENQLLKDSLHRVSTPPVRRPTRPQKVG
jgi:hypothetical protein